MWHARSGVPGLYFLTAGPGTTPFGTTVASRDGVAIAYEVHGEAEPTLVLVHGLTNNRTFWEPHLPRLTRAHRVAMLDLAGHGESGSERQDWSMRSFGEDVAAMARVLPSEQLVMVGFSLGGGAVLEAASMVPERVLGIVLVDVYQNIEARLDDADSEAFIAGLQAGWRDPEVIRRAGFSPTAPAALVERFMHSTPDNPPDCWWRAFRDFFAHWNNGDLVRTIAQIRAPIAAINSWASSTGVAAFRKYAPSFTAATIPDVGHVGILWEKPDLFVDLLLQAVAQFSGAAAAPTAG